MRYRELLRRLDRSCAVAASTAVTREASRPSLGTRVRDLVGSEPRRSAAKGSLKFITVHQATLRLQPSAARSAENHDRLNRGVDAATLKPLLEIACAGAHLTGETEVLVAVVRVLAPADREDAGLRRRAPRGSCCRAGTRRGIRVSRWCDVAASRVEVIEQSPAVANQRTERLGSCLLTLRPLSPTARCGAGGVNGTAICRRRPTPMPSPVEAEMFRGGQGTRSRPGSQPERLSKREDPRFAVARLASARETAHRRTHPL